MKYIYIVIFQLIQLVVATPPACFLSCINEVSRTCEGGHTDLSCLCGKQSSVLGCLVDICPYGNFESSRDHYFGTCLEHGRSTNGNYPPVYSSPSEGPKETEIPEPEEPDCDTSTKIPDIVTQSPDTATKTYPGKPTETGCDDDEDYDICEWEEEEYTESDGTVVAIRKPIKVPEKYLKPPYTDAKKRILIIKTLKSDKGSAKANNIDLSKMKFTKELNKKLQELKSKNSKNSNFDYKLPY